MKVGMISLGCSKNQVDSEMMLGLLTDTGFEITSNIEEADLVIVNTCGFITASKKEAIDAICECINDKRDDAKLVVTGCFAERYKEVVEKEFPEVDKVIGVSEYSNFTDIINDLFKVNKLELSFNKRVLISNNFSPYVRIADGCNNHCAFCAIPLIRGKFISRSMEDILDEVNYLVKNGAKEINIVAQDSSKYGIDNYHKLMLPELLKEIAKISDIFMIRVYYIYPETVTDELIKVVKENSKICAYFDIPFQHGANHILDSMGRHFSREKASALIKKIKAELPNAVIRTTLMVGFPGETDEDFNELIDFVKESEFFHMGAFTYSREEDTKAYDMKPRILKSVANKRYKKLMEVQNGIALSLKKKLIGNTYDCLIDDYDDESYTFSLRSYMFASDDVDGSIIATCPYENEYKPGDIVKVKIIDASAYELYGEIIKG